MEASLFPSCRVKDQIKKGCGHSVGAHARGGGGGAGVPTLG